MHTKQLGNMQRFTEEYERKRSQALEDRTGFTDLELEWLDIEPAGSQGLTPESTFKVPSNPVDTRSTKKTIDMRTRPEAGGV